MPTKKTANTNRDKSGRLKPIPGGRYHTRWIARKAREAAMTQEDKDYRDRLKDLVEEIDLLRQRAPMMNGAEIGTRLRNLAEEYRPESRPVVTDPAPAQAADAPLPTITAAEPLSPTPAELFETERTGTV